MGRSRGGFSTKIHAVVDGLGNPLKFILTPGQNSDVIQAEKLLEEIESDFVLADKGYDSNNLIEFIQQKGAIAVIPPKSNRKCPREYDKFIYKDRNLVERFFNLIKHFRRVATRYEKLSNNYLGFIYFASSIILMR